jgi:hypothetical protein
LSFEPPRLRHDERERDRLSRLDDHGLQGLFGIERRGRVWRGRGAQRCCCPAERLSIISKLKVTGGRQPRALPDEDAAPAARGDSVGFQGDAPRFDEEPVPLAARHDVPCERDLGAVGDPDAVPILIVFISCSVEDLIVLDYGD